MLCSQTKIRNSGKKVCFTKFFIKCYLNLYTRARNQFLKTAGDRHQCFREHERMHANNAELLHDFESFSICSLRIVLKVTEKRKLRQQNEQKAGRNCVSLKYTFEFLQIKVLNERITKTENGQPYDSREPFNLWFKDT